VVDDTALTKEFSRLSVGTEHVCVVVFRKEKLMDATTFSSHSNAKRAAVQMLTTGQAPAAEFRIEAAADDRFAVVWLSKAEAEADSILTGQPAPAPTTEQVETEIAVATAKAEQPSPPAAKTAEDDELVAVETPRLIAELERRGYRSTPARKPRNARASAKQPRPNKEAELDEATARGVMPEKPIITSPANQHYQKRFDRLAELAAADDWTAIEAYAVNGSNTYAEKLRRYRDRLLIAHAASAPAPTAEE
jgi:hypothetical protein